MHGDHCFGLPGLLQHITDAKARATPPGATPAPTFVYGPSGLVDLLSASLDVRPDGRSLAAPVTVSELVLARLGTPVEPAQPVNGCTWLHASQLPPVRPPPRVEINVRAHAPCAACELLVDGADLCLVTSETLAKLMQLAYGSAWHRVLQPPPRRPPWVMIKVRAHLPCGHLLLSSCWPNSCSWLWRRLPARHAAKTRRH
jgi:hypothetical protein